MIVEENASKLEADRLLERAKDPPYDFAFVPDCRRDLHDSVIVRVTSRRMCTSSIGEFFYLCNEAARRRSFLKQGPEGGSFTERNAGRETDSPLKADTFLAGEVISCPGCLRDMKAPMRARGLRCANCRAEIYPGHGKSQVPAAFRKHIYSQGACPSEQANTVGAQSETIAVHAATATTPVERSYDKPLSLDYIADRLDIDSPLRGFMVRHKAGGWLQGFILVTTFTTWQRFFRWDSLAKEAGLVQAHEKGAQGVWDYDGRLTTQMEMLPRSGDPEKEGVIWGRIAELSLLGGLKCGRFLLQLALEEIEGDDDYDFLVLQATDTSRSFYEGLGFVRVGAVAKVCFAVKDHFPSRSRHPWISSCWC